MYVLCMTSWLRQGTTLTLTLPFLLTALHAGLLYTIFFEIETEVQKIGAQ